MGQGRYKVGNFVWVVERELPSGQWGPLIREYLKGQWWIETVVGSPDAAREAMAFQALQVANRMEVMPDLMQAVGSTSYVVACRYWQSGWVYGQLDGLDPEWLRELHFSMAQPDINILLDISPEAAMARRASRDGDAEPERYEGKLERTRKIVELYRKLWRAERGRSTWPVVDASKPIPQVISEVWSCLGYLPI